MRKFLLHTLRMCSQTSMSLAGPIHDAAKKGDIAAIPRPWMPARASTTAINWGKKHLARPEIYPVKKVIGFDQGMLDAIDDWRRKQKPIPTVSDAIRRLVELGLKKGKSS